MSSNNFVKEDWERISLIEQSFIKEMEYLEQEHFGENKPPAKITIEMSKEQTEKTAKEMQELNASGYAGILPTGEIVDRRKFPKAIPIQKNSMLGVNEPKKL